MFVISREEAIYLFYAVSYNKENAEKYTKKIDEMEAVTICYPESPKKTFLCSLKSMHANPSEYKVFRSMI